MERGESESLVGSLFGGFSTVIGAQLTDQTERISLAAGEWLFREGDRADFAYLVHSGRVEIVAEHPTEVVLRQVKRSEMLGEHALLMGGARTASARASRDTELTRLSRAQFEKLLSESPGFALGLLRAMATQISSVQGGNRRVDDSRHDRRHRARSRCASGADRRGSHNRDRRPRERGGVETGGRPRRVGVPRSAETHGGEAGNTSSSRPAATPSATRGRNSASGRRTS